MADYGLVLIFGEEFLGSRECYLVDVTVDFLGIHSYASVGDGEGLLVGVDADADSHVAQLALELVLGGEGLQLLGCVDRVGYQLAKEYLVIRIQKLLDDGEYVLRRHAYFSVFHNHIFFCIYFLK